MSVKASPTTSKGLGMEDEGRSFWAEAPRWEGHIVLQRLRGDQCFGWEGVEWHPMR